MKQILAIAYKDLRIRFSSWNEWIFFLILPLVFTFAISGGVSGYSDNRIAVLVVNQDKGELSNDLVAALRDSKTIRVVEADKEEAETKFRNREASAMLIIPAGLEEARTSGAAISLPFTAAAGDLNSVAAEQAIRAATGSIGRTLLAAGISTTAAEEVKPFPDAAARETYYRDAKEKAQELFDAEPSRIDVTQPAPKDSTEQFWSPQIQSSAGQLITWVFIPLLGISEIFAVERTLGTLRRMVSAPVSKSVVLIGTISGQLLTALVQMGLLSAFGMLVLHVPWWRNPAATLTMFLAFGLAAVAFGTMLGTFVRTAGQASGISVALGMTMALLGGCWYPRDLFPEAVQKIVLVLPTAWAISGFNDILLRNRSLFEILPTAGVLVGFAVVFFAIGIWRYRYE